VSAALHLRSYSTVLWYCDEKWGAILIKIRVYFFEDGVFFIAFIKVFRLHHSDKDVKLWKRKLRALLKYEQLIRQAKEESTEESLVAVDKAYASCYVKYELRGPFLEKHEEVQMAVKRGIGIKLVQSMKSKTSNVKDLTNSSALHQLQEECTFTLIACLEHYKLAEIDVRVLRDKIRLCHNLIQDLKGAIRVFIREKGCFLAMF